ncbi:hypothetical protein Patl1_28831 [Pistacia atlantica]|uniref:Uncharacterized protein n=1 Tax=Pistacia atlantica TaxID=434234 RepID=A0ACC1BET4_9ROSI|nr:hypothetical protein Patl1_28831 [Pistacia atlantica]
MDCFHCSGTKTFLPEAFSRLAGDAWIIDSSSGCGTKFLCRNVEGQLGWCCNMSYYWLLPIARAHSSIRRIQKFLHSNQRNIKHCWHYPSVGVPCVGTGSPLYLGSLNSLYRVLKCLCSTT